MMHSWFSSRLSIQSNRRNQHYTSLCPQKQLLVRARKHKLIVHGVRNRQGCGRLEAHRITHLQRLLARAGRSASVDQGTHRNEQTASSMQVVNRIRKRAWLAWPCCKEFQVCARTSSARAAPSRRRARATAAHRSAPASRTTARTKAESRRSKCRRHCSARARRSAAAH